MSDEPQLETALRTRPVAFAAASKFSLTMCRTRKLAQPTLPFFH